MKKLSLVLLALGLAACGSSSSGSSSTSGSTGATTAGNGSTSGATTTTGGSTGSTTTGGSSSTTTTTTGGSTGGTTTTGGSSGSTGGTTGSTTGPITNLPDEQWLWVDFPGALCRDGSPTGIGINYNPASTNLLIFLNGGGACIEQFTCSTNPSHFGASDFTSMASGNAGPGIFDRADPTNPAKDWSFVFVPYCTGDVHAGNNPNATVPNVAGTQQFVGYENIAAYLQRLVPTFPSVTKIVLAGSSAGGFGAAANYTQVARAFPNVPVELLDDSGPMMGDPYLASCLQDKVRALWGLDSTIIADCGADCPDSTNYMLDYSAHVAFSYPEVNMGLVESTDDGTITQFFGLGANNCTGFQQLSAADFTAGLDQIRTTMAPYANFGTYYFDSTQHTVLGDAMSTAYIDGGPTIGTWVTEITDGGTMTNEGP